MLQIIKRLEIIKSSILIEDIEIIDLQIMKLNSLKPDENIQDIILHLENSEYPLALEKIESFISRYSGIVVYEDKELLSLKFSLKQLEIKLQELIEEKIEYLKNIEEFNKEYNLHLGDIIKTILNLRKEILYKKTIKQKEERVKYKEQLETYNEIKNNIEEIKSNIDELEDILEMIDEDYEKYDEIKQSYDELREELERLEKEKEKLEEELQGIIDFIEDETIQDEFEEAKSFYEDFETEYEIIKDKQKDIIELSEDEKTELKKLFRKAAKLCHPDIVTDENKEQAHKIMQELNEAYEKQDILKVKAILNSLESGFGFEVSSDSVDDKELLKVKITEFEQNIQNLKLEIETIKQDDTYQTISNLENWDEYFEELKTSLENEKNILEEEINSASFFDEEIEEWIKKLWKWADDNKISNDLLSRKRDNLLNKTIIDFTSKGLKDIPKELFKLQNITTLILWDNDIIYLPEEIVNFVNLKKLNLRGNPKLAISEIQKQWLDKLINQGCIVYKDKIRIIGEKSSNSDEFIFTKNSNFNATDIKEKPNNDKKYDDYWESEF